MCMVLGGTDGWLGDFDSEGRQLCLRHLRSTRQVPYAVALRFEDDVDVFK